MKKNTLFLSGLFCMLSVIFIFIDNKPTGLLPVQAVKHFILVLSPLSVLVLMGFQQKRSMLFLSVVIHHTGVGQKLRQMDQSVEEALPFH
ncbi:MAG TPA: hypothetical protein VK645_02005 [Chitinophagaceae bacterium]|nr:hypothetical protein [Chitinophagaceae bacterium]